MERWVIYTVVQFLMKTKHYNENKKNKVFSPQKVYFFLLANGNFVLLEGVICAVGLESMKD